MRRALPKPFSGSKTRDEALNYIRPENYEASSTPYKLRIDNTFDNTVDKLDGRNGFNASDGFNYDEIVAILRDIRGQSETIQNKMDATADVRNQGTMEGQN